MRNLAVNEINTISGGSTVYYFDLFPGVEVVGFEQVLLGYDTVSWVEHGFLIDHHYEVSTPIYQYNPIYSETVTTYSYY